MEVSNEKAFMHMMKTPLRLWSISQFMTYIKCDTLLRSMSEGFNNVIIKLRVKPIVIMLEEIKTYIMELWVTNRMRFP